MRIKYNNIFVNFLLWPIIQYKIEYHKKYQSKDLKYHEKNK